MVGIRAVELGSHRRPLLSLKLSEFTDRRCGRPGPVELRSRSIRAVSACVRRDRGGAAARGRSAARSIAATASSSVSCSRCGPDIQELFCPGTILNPQRFQRTELSVFTFGMAHKIRVPLYRRLHDLLEATGQSYSVYVSTALHENTSFDGSFVVRFEELQSIFNGQVYFMGYLSDTAVFNHLMDCTFLAAFFEKGLRANNTTVNAAMECGCAVITNLDEHSPAGLTHMTQRHRHQPVRATADCRGERAHRPRGAGDGARASTDGTSSSRSCARWRPPSDGTHRAACTPGDDSGRHTENRRARDWRPHALLRDRRDRTQPPGQPGARRGSCFARRSWPARTR